MDALLDPAVGGCRRSTGPHGGGLLLHVFAQVGGRSSVCCQGSWSSFDGRCLEWILNGTQFSGFGCMTEHDSH